MLVLIKRIYEKPSITDGKRILVDRLWPRGVKRSTANVDLWLKAVAPSNELRQWFNHSPQKWEDFKKRYRKELDGNKALQELVHIIQVHDVTLLFASKDEKHNNAIALSEFLKKEAKKTS